MLYSHETRHSSRIDLDEPNDKARVRRWTDGGQNMSEWVSQIPHISRHRGRSRRLHGKVAGKKNSSQLSAVMLMSVYGHRCRARQCWAMATFVIRAQRKNDSRKKRNDKQRSNSVKYKGTYRRPRSEEAITFEERYQKLEEKDQISSQSRWDRRKQRSKLKWKQQHGWSK